MSSVFSDPEPEGFDSFPDQVRDDVEGLIWLGFLQDSFSFCGHDFVIRTLRGDEELLASLVTKEFVETLGQSRAWAWATIALAIESVDGDEAFCPPAGPNKKEFARARFQYVTSRWYWPIAEYIYRRYSDLLIRQAKAVEAMEDFSRENLSTFTPFAGFSTDKGVSAQEATEIMEFLQEDPDSTS